MSKPTRSLRPGGSMRPGGGSAGVTALIDTNTKSSKKKTTTTTATAAATSFTPNPNAAEFEFNPNVASFTFNPTAVAYTPPSGDAATSTSKAPDTPSESKTEDKIKIEDVVVEEKKTTEEEPPHVEPFKRAPNAWIPPSSRGRSEKNPSQEATALLNKLTVEKFHSIVPKLVELMSTTEVIDKVLHVLLNKVESDHHFSELYSRLALALCTTNSAAKMNHYCIKTLLNNVQKRFHKNNPIVPTYRPNSYISKKRREEMMEVYDIEVLKGLGLIKYLGRLHAVGILPEVALHDCIVRLMGEQPLVHGMSAINVQKLVELLRVVGKNIDTSNEKNAKSKKHLVQLDCGRKWLQSYMEILRQITAPNGLGNGIRGSGGSAVVVVSSGNAEGEMEAAEEEEEKKKKEEKRDWGDDDEEETLELLQRGHPLELPLRLSFIVAELFELKSNDWVPRRKTETAKTLTEVREERDADELQLREEVSTFFSFSFSIWQTLTDTEVFFFFSFLRCTERSKRSS